MDRRLGGYWIAPRHAEVSAMSRGTQFSTGQIGADGTMQGISTPPPGHTGRMLPLELDAPQSLKYRKLLAPFYSPSRVAGRMPELRRLATSCVDSIIDHGGGDLVPSLTLRLPGVLTMRDIGLPESRWEAIGVEIHGAMLSMPHDPTSAREAAQLVCLEIIDSMEVGGDDRDGGLIAHLLRCEIDGEPVAAEDIVSMTYALLFGVDSTSTLTATTLWYLAAHPELREALVRNPCTGR